MSLLRLRLESLRYHWRGNLAVFLGVAVGTAVLTGALLVGDALRGSLRDLTLQRLGWVDQAIVGPHFVRQEIADHLPADRVAPVILLQATAARPNGAGIVRRITLYGVERHFGVPELEGHPDGVVLNAALARELNVPPPRWFLPPRKITFRVQKAADVPRESVLGKRDAADVFDDVTATVAAVLPEDDEAGRFSLNPSPETPRNAFVPLRLLQDALDQPGRVNAFLVGGPRGDLDEAFRRQLTLGDWGLTLWTPGKRADALVDRVFHDLNLPPADEMRRSEWENEHAIPDAVVRDVQKTEKLRDRNRLSREQVRDYFRHAHPYLSLESRQLLLEPAVARAALAAAGDADLRAAPTLVYLCKL